MYSFRPRIAELVFRGRLSKGITRPLSLLLSPREKVEIGAEKQRECPIKRGGAGTIKSHLDLPGQMSGGRIISLDLPISFFRDRGRGAWKILLANGHHSRNHYISRGEKSCAGELMNRARSNARLGKITGSFLYLRSYIFIRKMNGPR